MLGMTDIRKGKVIVWEDEPFVVVSAEFLRKQKTRPVMRTILKHLVTGATKEHSFHQSDKVAEADVERKQVQYLYANNDRYVFMDLATYEQIELEDKIVGDQAEYLLEGENVEVLTFEGNPVMVELPIKVKRRVVESPPGVRGDTSTNVMKDAVLEGGVKAKVPLFVSEGDTIVLDTRTGTYVERV